MRYQLRTVSSQGVEEIAYQGLHTLVPGKIFWLEIQADSRQEVISFMDEFDFDRRLIEQVEDPSKSTRVNIHGNSLIINLVIPDTANIYESEYLTLIGRSNILISILSEHSTLFDDLKQEGQYDLLELDFNMYNLLYYIFGEIIQQGMEILAISRQRIKDLNFRVDSESDAVPLEEIILCKREISQLANVAEDQYNMLAFVPKVKWTDEYKEVRLELTEQIHGLAHVKNSFERLEERVDEIHAHYQLILQEKGNKKLNTLTIVQAIFVPLTFLAGIYGMNFLFMPELQWKYGYFIILGLMISISVVQLWWFKRKGWFD